MTINWEEPFGDDDYSTRASRVEYELTSKPGFWSQRAQFLMYDIAKETRNFCQQKDSALQDGNLELAANYAMREHDAMKRFYRVMYDIPPPSTGFALGLEQAIASIPRLISKMPRYALENIAGEAFCTALGLPPGIFVSARGVGHVMKRGAAIARAFIAGDNEKGRRGIGRAVGHSLLFSSSLEVVSNSLDTDAVNSGYKHK